MEMSSVNLSTISTKKMFFSSTTFLYFSNFSLLFSRACFLPPASAMPVNMFPVTSPKEKVSAGRALTAIKQTGGVTRNTCEYLLCASGIHWSNSYTSPIAGDTCSFGWLCWLILIDSILYFIIGAYVRMVFPGKPEALLFKIIIIL